MSVIKISALPVAAPNSSSATDQHLIVRGGQDVLVPASSITATVAPLAWTGSTEYNPGQTVTFGGNTYVCLVANGDIEPPSNSDFWQLQGAENLDSLADGATYARTLAVALTAGIPYTFTGQWNSTTYYLVGQETIYEGNFWICTAPNSNSAPSTTNTSWGLEGTSSLYLGAWSASVNYVNGNIVSLGGNLYSCTTANINSEPPSANWLLVGPSNLDSVSDGSTYAKTLASALTNGIPTPFQGVWSSVVTYNPGMEVTYTGSYWACLVACTNSAPAVGNINWVQVGTVSNQFQGAYNSDTAYTVGNQTTYGSPASLYICIVNSTGNAPTNGTYWQEISSVSTANYLGAYNSGTSYLIGNQTSYEGSFYVCVSNSTGNAPSPSSGYWTLLGTSTILLGAWSSATAYVAGNQVTLGGNVYQCITGNTNVTPPSADWQLIGPANLDAILDGSTYARTLATSLQSGVPYTYLGAWSSSTHYVVGQEVTYNGAYWICVVNNTNSAPTQANTNWGLEGSAALLMGPWSSATAYVISNQVTLGGNVYSCIEANTNNTPPNATYWTLLGPATLDSIQDGSSYARTLAVALEAGIPYTFTGAWSSVTSYLVGQEVTYKGNYYICVVNNSNSAPTPTNTNWGLVGTSALLLGAWSNSVAYVQGNQVSSGGNIYACILANTNEAVTNTTYWTLLGPLSLDNIANGSTYSKTLASGITSGVVSTVVGSGGTGTPATAGSGVAGAGTNVIAVLDGSGNVIPHPAASVIQSGRIYTTGGSSHPIVFPDAFNTVPTVVCSAESQSCNIGLNSVTKTQFWTNQTSPGYISWAAIGT